MELVLELEVGGGRGGMGGDELDGDGLAGGEDAAVDGGGGAAAEEAGGVEVGGGGAEAAVGEPPERGGGGEFGRKGRRSPATAEKGKVEANYSNEG